MKKSALDFVLQAEAEYRETIQKSTAEAESYAEQRKERQAAALEDCQYEWYLFEKEENEKLSGMIERDRAAMEAERIKIKKHLKNLQEQKIESIGERIKKEVLGVYGNRENGEARAGF